MYTVQCIKNTNLGLEFDLGPVGFFRSIWSSNRNLQKGWKPKTRSIGVFKKKKEKRVLSKRYLGTVTPDLNKHQTIKPDPKCD